MSDCVFCRIATGEIPASFVYQDDHVVVFKDLHPVAPVHLLIVPRIHAEDIIELAGRADGETVLGAVLRAVPAVAEAAGVAADGFRLINNCGADGGQTIRHVHFHLIGGRNLGERLL